MSKTPKDKGLIAIELKDGKKMYARLDQAKNGPSKRLVIVSHGLAGKVEEYLLVMARNVFMHHGYDVLRVMYYSKYKDARNLVECTYALHAEDLNQMVAAMRPQYKWIAAAGHSSGGLVMLRANPKVEAIALWEPPFIHAYFVPVAVKIESENLYRVGRGTEFLISSAMYEEGKAMNEDNALPWAQNLSAPTQLILSDNGKTSQHMQTLYNNLPGPKELAVVNGADHLFTNGDCAVKMLEQTCRWFARF